RTSRSWTWAGTAMASCAWTATRCAPSSCASRARSRAAPAWTADRCATACATRWRCGRPASGRACARSWSKATSAFRPESVRRLRRAEVAAVHPGAVEAAHALLAVAEHVDRRQQALAARLGLLARGHPRDPVAARDRGGGVPGRLRRRVGLERVAQVGRDPGLRLLRCGRDRERHGVAGFGAGGLAQRARHLQP